MYKCVCVCYLHILYSAGLSLTKHAEQEQDQLLDVLQCLLLGHQIRMHLVQYLQNTHTYTHTHTSFHLLFAFTHTHHNR